MYFGANEIILVVAAVIPAILLLVRVYQADRLEKEPKRLLLSLIFLGIFSTGMALATEEIGTFILDIFLYDDSMLYRFLMYFIVVGLSEEGFKYLLLNKKTWRSPEFNCQFDGVVYAVFVSLGFALWENIEYALFYGDISTVVVRAITAVPGHAAFGVFMGLYYGFAKRAEVYGDFESMKQCKKKALWVPVLIHGCYDFIATMDGLLMLGIFVIFIITVFSRANKMVKAASSYDEYLF